jgi:glucose/arabinose dehydrogenase
MMNRQLAARFCAAMLLALFTLSAFAEVSGTWVFTSQIQVGHDIARVELKEHGEQLWGRYFGLLGHGRTVKGTRRGDQIVLIIEGEWPQDGSAVQATISGTLGSASGSGDLGLGPLGQGTWTASRPGKHDDLEPSAKVSVDYRSQRPGASRTIRPADLPPASTALTLASPPKLIARPRDAWPKAPHGFRVSLYADGFDYPRKIQTAPNGDVFLAESHRGEIKILRGVNREGRARTVATFATGLKQPFGIAFYPSGSNPKYVYVANTDSVVRFPYQNGDLIARAAAEVIIASLPAGGGAVVGGGHWTRDLAFSKNDAELYVSVGSFSNSDDTDSNPREVRRADVLGFTPDGQFTRIYASGIRNPVGIAVDPGSGQLWCTGTERDLMGNDLVPDYVTHVEPGGFYGWPWFYIGSNWDPQHQGKHPELIGTVLTPDVLLQAHTVPLALTFYDGHQFPGQYQGDLFVAAHGSWNRFLRTGYEVIRLRLEGGMSAGDYEDFLTGFVTKEGEVWGRPVGVTVAGDGSLLVSDDGSKSVWRVSYAADCEHEHDCRPD